MEDRELKKLLLETCPVRPGQEDRAWQTLRGVLYGQSLVKPWFLNWRVGLGCIAAVLILSAAAVLLSPSHALATADSQAPGIYATAFYSPTAKAQVVWLNGMEPASDKPTYLDPTSPVPEKAEPAAPASAEDPNRL